MPSPKPNKVPTKRYKGVPDNGAKTIVEALNTIKTIGAHIPAFFTYSLIKFKSNWLPTNKSSTAKTMIPLIPNISLLVIFTGL